MDENKEKINWWKILALIIIGILIGIFIGVKVLSAFEWSETGLNKAGTCNLFNKTGIDCEVFWCNNINDGNYSLEKEACFIYNYTNETNCSGLFYYNYSNYTGNLTLNATQINDVVKSCILSNCTFFDSFTLKGYIDNQTISLRNSIMDTQENRTIEILRKEYPSFNEDNNPTTTPMPTWVWIFAIISIVGLVAFLVWNNNKNKEKRKVYDEDRDRRYPNKRSIRPLKPYLSKNLPKAKIESLRKAEEEKEKLEPDEEIGKYDAEQYEYEDEDIEEDR